MSTTLLVKRAKVPGGGRTVTYALVADGRTLVLDLRLQPNTAPVAVTIRSVS